MPRVALETLGCKLNQYETDAIAAGFLSLGWEIAEAGSAADAYVVNTCTVTNKADKKSRHAVTKHLEGSQAAPVVVVTGCFAESARESLEGRDGVTFVVPNANKNQIPALVDSCRKGELARPELPLPDRFGFPVHGKIFHTRASLKIQDGCDNFCTFCIIPMVRGRAVSRPRNEILEAARELLAGGRRELVLTGVNMGRWSEGGRTFTDLVRDLLSLDGDFRLRITSLEPEGLGELFAELLTHPKMAPHLHLCLQTGSPRILLAMRRDYNLEQYRSLVALFRARQPGLNVTTDLIVGFPGETEADWNQSVAEVRALELGGVHVFPYSVRQGTRAERMSDHLSETVKSQRSRMVQTVALELRHKAMEARVGQIRRVLVETPDQGRTKETWVRGLSEDYFPVRYQGSGPWNTFASVRLLRVVFEDGDWVWEAEPV